MAIATQRRSPRTSPTRNQATPGVSSSILRPSPEEAVNQMRITDVTSAERTYRRGRARPSVELLLPPSGDAVAGPGHWLLKRVMAGRSQLWPIQEVLGRVVPEPVLAGLVTLDDRVAGIGRMVTCVLGRRRITATDVAAARAATQVKPPASGGDAFRAARTARRHRRIDVHLAIDHPLSELSDGGLFSARRDLVRLTVLRVRKARGTPA